MKILAPLFSTLIAASTQASDLPPVSAGQTDCIIGIGSALRRISRCGASYGLRSAQPID